MVPPLKITCAANDAIAKIVKDSQIVILLFHMKERKKESSLLKMNIPKSMYRYHNAPVVLIFKYS